MPVHLQTAFGQATYPVTTDLQTLATACDQQEVQLARLQRDLATEIAAHRTTAAALQQLTAQVNALQRQVNTP